MKIPFSGSVMKNSKIDIVYIYRKMLNTDELRYSLRSVEKNWPHRNIWVIGDRLDWFSDNIRVLPIKTSPDLRPYKDVNFKLLMACREEEISEDFWFFNDDFFIMSRINPRKFLPYRDDTLVNRQRYLMGQRRLGRDNQYIESFESAIDILDRLKCSTQYNYETHCPFLFNKSRLEWLVDDFNENGCRRSIYGNYFKVPASEHKDCKIYGINEKVNLFNPVISTSDLAFSGLAGRVIKQQFKEKSRYER